MINVNFNADGTVKTAFTTKKLEQVISTVYREPVAPLMGEVVLPPSSIVNAGAQTYLSQQSEGYGEAAIVANGTDDVPIVDVAASAVSRRVVEIACAFNYSMTDLEAAAFANTDLNIEKARIAEREHNRRHSKLAFYGSSIYGIEGLLTTPNIPVVTAPQNAGATSTLLADKTPDEMADTILELIDSVVERTNGAETADTLVVDYDVRGILSRTRMTDGTTTVMQYIQAQRPNVTILLANELKASERAKNMDTDPFTGGIAVAYVRNKAGVAYHKPMSYVMYAPQLRLSNYTTLARSKSGGSEIIYPLEFTIMQGLT